MKSRRGILSVLAIALVLIVLSIASSANAATKYLGIERVRSSGYGYEENESVIWKITSYSDEDGNGRSQDTTYYCLKAGPGFGSRDGWGELTGTRLIRAYDQSFDLKDRDSIPDPYDSVIVDGQNYNSVMWILEHAYIPELSTASADKAALLSAAGITRSQLTDNDIDVIQQLAIWYFTNTETTSAIYPNYHRDALKELGLRRMGTGELTPISSLSLKRADDASALYTYLIESAEAAGSTAPTQNNKVNPVTVSSTANTVLETSGNYYIVGPYSITQNTNIDYNLTATLGNGISYTILDSNKNQVSSLKDTISGGQFYVRVAASDYVSGLVFNVSASTSQRGVNYLSVTAANEGGLTYDQPVAQVVNENKNYQSQLVMPHKPEDPVFDLNLRKFISTINGAAPTVSRVPVVDVTPLINNTGTSAIYKHTKQPLGIAPGDEIIYTIRVYNEGDVNAKVTEIKDHLPAQLTYVDDAFNREQGWSISQDGRTATATLTDKTVEAFDPETMDTLAYVDIQIKCKVNPNVTDAGLVLTNIAQITGATDENGVAKIDEDSILNNVELPSDEDLPNYRGNDNNKNDLSDSDYYYRGQEDDDDFEKVLLKSFDLALRKFITSINDTDVATLTGTSREPVITAQQIATLKNRGTTTVAKSHSKTPLRIANGDTIVYTIRVYNEGEINGMASEVTDYLPAGLSLLPDSRINTENGWVASQDGKTVTTTKLANTVIEAFNGNEIKYVDLQIECVVSIADSAENQSLKNVAAITGATDENGTAVSDRDSSTEGLTQTQIDNYVPGTPIQDDDDGEEVIVPGKKLDLALRKFITHVNNTRLEDGQGNLLKEPVVNVTPLVTGGTNAEYRHQKAPVGVAVGDEVIYTIRIYNEGEIAGYAAEITEHLPPQLEYVNDSFNAKYGWEVSADGRTVKTDITSSTTDKSATRDEVYQDRTSETNKVLIAPFNGTELDYIDVQIKCKVKEVTNTDYVVTNIAEISKAVDVNGSVTERDSTPGNVELPTTDKEWSDYRGNSGKSVLTDPNYYYKGQEDDDDFDKLKIQAFDLALRKFITAKNETVITNRAPVFTTNKDSKGNYIYRQNKETVPVQTTDVIEYTIRVYNEGDIAGYAKEVKDNIPSGLEFLPDNSVNTSYGWKMIDEEGNVTTDVEKAVAVVTDYLSKDQETATGRDNLIRAFEDALATPDYRDIKVVFKVVATSANEGIVTNIAEIADDEDENGNPVIDKDSTPDNNDPDEDDQDEEKVVLGFFDLALRKFVSKVDDKDIIDRVPTFKVVDGKYTYEQEKTPLSVENGNIVVYTLRVYNEGTVSGYAKEVKDNIPANLVFLPENEVNTEYRWKMIDAEGNETEDVTKAVAVVTDYLSKDQEDETGRENLIKAFDQDSMNEPNHKEVKIAFKVTEPKTADRILKNIAQISDDENENGDPVPDKDSTPDNNDPDEDDQDEEQIKVKYFDLKLDKWTTHTIVIENGKEKVTETGHQPGDNKVVKIEIAKNKIDSVVVKFRYKIRVTNEGEIPGYALEIKEYVPDGLKFVAADNPDWKESNGSITTDKLANKLLQPGESADVEVLLTWANSANQMGQKTNFAEISKDKNDSDTPDIDSTPDNKDPNEDDMDGAPVLITTKTGELVNMTYIILAVASLGIITIGAILIKKFILK